MGKLTPPPYQYRPLPTPFHLRTCTIYPANEKTDPIVIVIDTVPFDENDAASWPPYYEALSYVWGSEEDPATVLVDCPDGIVRSLSVTQNLYCALQNMRRPRVLPQHLLRDLGGRTMWIDAICINQKDSAEKGPQVAMMSRIYLFASRVVVWLGPAADNSHGALKFMEAMNLFIKNLADLGQPVEVDEEALGRARLDYVTVDDRDGDGMARFDTPAFVALLLRPWFSRVWVRQEVFVASETAVVLCGETEIPWQFLRKSIGILCGEIERDPPPGIPAGDIARAVGQASAFFIHSGDSMLTLLELRRAFRFAECKDPRDYLFGALGLLGEGEQPGIVPDYDKPYQQIFLQSARQYLEGRGSPAFITCCALDPDGPADTPSWVPDWSRQPEVDELRQLTSCMGPFAGCCLPFHAKILEDESVLRVVGVFSCKIEYVSQRAGQSADFRESIDLLRQLPSVLGPSTFDASDQPDVFNVYARALTGGVSSDRMYPQPSNLPDIEMYSDTFRRLLHDELDAQYLKCRGNRDIHLQMQLMGLCKNLIGRRLGWDASGAPVLCPWQTQAGDYVVVIAGCDWPIVVRPSPVTKSAYIVVGQCFSVATCDGEAFLGPLPENTRAVLHYDADYATGFLDDSTGQISMFDPRLSDEDVGSEIEGEFPYKSLGADFDRFSDLVRRKTGEELRWIDLV